MKILFISAVFPYPLHSGGQIRIYNLLKSLSKKHQITLLSFIRNENEKKLTGNLPFIPRIEIVFRGKVWRLEYLSKALFGDYPLLLASYDNELMRRKIYEELSIAKYDLIHIEPGYVWPSLPRTNLPVVVSEHNIESVIYGEYAKASSIFLRLLFKWDVAKLKFWEKKIWQKASAITAVSSEEANEIKNNLEKDRVAIVPNGVDTNILKFNPHEKVYPEKPKLLFVGNFTWLQNRDAIRFLLTDIWPKIYEKYPGGILRIVGPHLPENLKKLTKQPGVDLRGEIKDIKEEYNWADIMLAPIRIGGGTKFKILEAMAVGLPVVTSLLGAAGLGVEPDKHLSIANNNEEILNKVDELLNNQTKRQEMVRQARKLIEQNYRWEEISKKLEIVWQKSLFSSK